MNGSGGDEEDQKLNKKKPSEEQRGLLRSDLSSGGNTTCRDEAQRVAPSVKPYGQETRMDHKSLSKKNKIKKGTNEQKGGNFNTEVIFHMK